MLPGYNMSPSEYQLHVTQLVAASLASENKSITRLVAALGCRNIRYTGRGRYVDCPEQPDRSNEAFVVQELIAALRRQVPDYHLQQTDSLSLLDGLLLNERWRLCLASEDDTYSLIAQILYFTWLVNDLLANPPVEGIRETLIPPLLSMLNSWLAPPVPFLEISKMIPLIRAMFGDVWCDLALPDVGSMSHPKLIQFVLRARPPLLPGLLPFGIEAISIDLPSLD